MTEKLTHEQREDFFVGLQMVDALEITDYVRSNHPDVFDLAADRVRQSRALVAEIHAIQGDAR